MRPVKKVEDSRTVQQYLICPAHINKILLPAMFIVIFILLAVKNPLSRKLEVLK